MELLKHKISDIHFCIHICYVLVSNITKQIEESLAVTLKGFPCGVVHLNFFIQLDKNLMSLFLGLSTINT